MKYHINKIILCCLLGIFSVSLFAQKKAKLTPDVKEDLKTAKVLLVRYEAPPLSFMTPKDAAGVGLIADATKSRIADERDRFRHYPAAIVQKNIDSLLRTEGLINSIEVKNEASKFMMPSKLKDLSKYENVAADYIIEVIVPLLGWRATYAPLKWKTYHLNLGVEVRIIRKSDLKRVWKTNVGYGGYNDKEMRFHITELKDGGKDLIANKLDKMALESARRVLKKYIKAKK